MNLPVQGAAEVEERDVFEEYVEAQDVVYVGGGGGGREETKERDSEAGKGLQWERLIARADGGEEVGEVRQIWVGGQISLPLIFIFSNPFIGNGYEITTPLNGFERVDTHIKQVS